MRNISENEYHDKLESEWLEQKNDLVALRPIENIFLFENWTCVELQKDFLTLLMIIFNFQLELDKGQLIKSDFFVG